VRKEFWWRDLREKGHLGVRGVDGREDNINMDQRSGMGSHGLGSFGSG
jgi:hypothetical protein